MGTGYTRQSSASIATSEQITAAPLNAEFNAIQAAFNSSTGHSHDGTSGEGPQINLTTSITGILPVANGGIAGIHKLNATAAPTTGDDTGDGYVAGSLWVDVTNDNAYICVDNTSTAAVWKQINSGTGQILGDLTATDGNFVVGNGSEFTVESGATARTSLGLGSISTQASNSVSITGGSITGITDLAVADGGTGASTAAGARTNLGLGALAVEAEVTTSLIAAATLVTEGDGIGANDNDTTIPTSAAVKDYADSLVGGGSALVASNNLSDVANAATSRANLGVAIGSDVQAFDAELSAIAGLVSAANKLPYFTGSTTAALTDFTAFARTLLDDADASAARTTLGLDIGTDVQAYDGTLAAIAALATTDGNIIVGNGSTFVAESGATARASLGLTIGSDVQAYDADILKADTADTLTAGFDITPFNAGTKTTGIFTPDPADGNLQYAINGGAHTLAVPTSSCSIVIQYTNNASAGAIGTSGFNLVDGDTYATTSGYDYFFYITVINSFSHLAIKRVA